MIFVATVAAQPIDEIRAILTKKALHLPSAETLLALNSKDLEKELQSIDRYARYVPNISMSDATFQPSYLGIDIFTYKSRLWICPILGGPADKAGLPEIGELTAINDKKIADDDLPQVCLLFHKALRNKKINLTIRDGKKENNYKIIPTSFKPSSVIGFYKGADLIIRISKEIVSYETAPGVYARLKVMNRSNNRFVLDLRGCSGGDLYEALEIAGMFVPAGLPLISTYERSGKVRIYRSPSGKKQRSPFLVLIDRRTASAAEILAGILQYHRLSRITGEQSYGKCVSQTLVPLSDGGGLWLTNMAIKFPDNSSCSESGIHPDIVYSDISTSKLIDIIKRVSNNKH